MTQRKDLEDAIAWATSNAELADASGDTALAARYRTLANSSEAELAKLPPEPSWTLLIWYPGMDMVAIPFASRSAAALEASNALARGACKVEIQP